MKRVKLVQLDGKLPNLALMKLAHWHRSQGDEVRLSTSAQPTLLDQEGADIVYGSAIFRRSLPRVEILRALHPQAVLGGTGSGEKLSRTVEQALGLEEYSYEHYELFHLPRVSLEPGLHPAGMQAQLRVLRGAGKGGEAPGGQHHRGHLEARHGAQRGAAGQRLLRAAPGTVAGPESGR